MKKSFKKLGFFSLAASGVLLGSMNATDLETYAALQKPSHVFGNYAEKDKDSKLTSDSPTQQQDQKVAQNTASNDSQEATTLENTASTDNTTATTDETYTKSTDTTVAGAAQKVETDNTAVQNDETYTKSTDTTVAGAAQKVETDNTAVQNDETALENAVAQVKKDADAKDFDETTFTKDQAAEQTAETKLQNAEDQLTKDQDVLETALKDQTPSTPPTPPTKKDETSGGTSGNTVASQLTKDTTMVNNLKSVSVSGMNTTLSGVETMSQQSATIGNLLNSSTDLSSVIPNAQGLNSAFSVLESAQNTLKGYLNSSSATIGQLINGSNAVVGALDKAINQVDMALADLSAADTQKTQAVTLATTGSSTTNSTTTDAINFLSALKNNLMAQKDAFMNVHKNIQTAVAQAQATYTPSVINTNNYGQMYGVDAMAGYKWFFGKTKRFGFRSYGYYSYNHANLSFVGSQLGIMEGASQVNNFTYGVGFDALYNFYESKEGYNTAGLFVGFGLGGDSFIVQGESYLKSQMQICNNTAGCSASMNTSYFQMPVEFGFRSNFSKHSGIEVGFKLPLFTNQFYKERGVDGSVDVFYKRNFSIYFNYMINF
ncbi:outer membrane protein [Helicobacter pylori]|uniref:outer membrane protein n=1 Tax=Helicobacter pylori TaxID=210 RepID=UPI000FDD6FEC|nr:outer membrane beta-barrel protein [Helicobacter pylori]RVY56852.1 outer membrane beta-barrel protein [Helicobacter pylori]